jgi:hypothetical protein
LLSLEDDDVATYLSFLEDFYAPKNVPASLPLRRRDDVDDLMPWPAESEERREPVDWMAHEQRAQALHEERRERIQEMLYACVQTDETRSSDKFNSNALAPGEAYAIHAHDPGGALSRDMQRVLEVATRIVGLDTQAPPQHQTGNLASIRPRDQNVLLDCVMQLEEALISTLRRRHA